MELDAGDVGTDSTALTLPGDEDDTVGIPYSVLSHIHSQMVIIVPCKNEPPETIRGVLKGIPQHCFILLVSNSARDFPGDDRFAKEVAMLRNFCRFGRKALAIHQKDPDAAAALEAAGMPELLGPDGLVRNGKGEGMILGLAVVAALCPEKKYAGFVDADSKLPGSPHEYCRIYAAGFSMHPDPEENVMVRIHWASKPKARGSQIDFSVTEGRSSAIVNKWLNRCLDVFWEDIDTDGGPDDGDSVVVTTANAGEHALTMSMALKLRMAGGYAIEPFHYVDLLQRQLRWLASPGTSSAASSSLGSASGSGSDTESVLGYPATLEAMGAKVLQIRSANPHIHNETDDSHVRAMWRVGLSTIYHHLLSLDDPEREEDITALRERMLAFVADDERKALGRKADDVQLVLREEDLLPKPKVYPALEVLDFKIFTDGLGKAESLHLVGH